MKILFILALLSMPIFAQQNPVAVPRDPTNTPVFGGLGVPVFAQPVINTTSYGTVTTVLDTSGLNAGRNYRNLYVNNPSAAIAILVCLGNSISCATDMIRVPPDSVLIFDQLLFGPNNNITTIYWKLESAGSVTADVGYW